MLRTRKDWILDFLLIFLLAAFLIRPMWKLKYTENWGSIESTFIADARMLKDHWPRPLWQPFWYVGTRFDYVYPPALRYGTAALAKYYPMDAAKAYHIYVSFFYCFGIAGIYLLARVGFRHRIAAIVAAIAGAIVSPGYLFVPEVAMDGFRLGTSKLNALVRYGEGPHMTALAWIPFALAFAWLSLRRRSYPWAIASGVASTMVVANNFYGATALAMFFPLLLWAIWVTERDWRLVRFALVIPLVAYGLSAFWLTPSYLEITLRNMQYVSSKGNLWSGAIFLLALTTFLSFTDRHFRSQPQRAWQLFVLGCAFFFTLNTAGNRWFNFRIIGEPARLVPEVDIVWIFLILLGCLWLWKRGMMARSAVILLAVATIGIHYNYILHNRAIFPTPTDYKPSLYYKIPDWIATNHPQARSYVTGAVRFWYNTWHDLHQLGGSSEQGLQNQIVMPSQWEIVLGEDPQRAIAWMQVLGVDLVAVHGPNSKEWYKDFQYPKKFDGSLTPIFDDGQDNRIFEIPRRYRSLARVVDRNALDGLPKLIDQSDLEGLKHYVKVLEHGPEAPTQTSWRGTDEFLVKAQTSPGQSLIVQVTYDPNWIAESNLGPLPVHNFTPLGFIRIDAPEGLKEIRFRFRKPFEKSAGEAIFLLTLIGMGWTLWRHRVSINSSHSA
jgi:hypothetical protein